MRRNRFIWASVVESLLRLGRHEDAARLAVDFVAQATLTVPGRRTADPPTPANAMAIWQAAREGVAQSLGAGDARAVL